MDRKNTKPLSILNVLEDARVGGPQISAMLLAETLVSDGVQTTIVTGSQDADHYSEMLRNHNIDHVNLQMPRLGRRTGEILRYVFSMPVTVARLVRLFRKMGPDIVQVAGAAQWRAAFASWLAGVPCIWTLNDTKQPAIIRWFFNNIASRFASAFVCVAERVESVYPAASRRNRPVAVIPAPIDLPRFERQSPRSSVALPGEGKLRVVTTGHINPDKNVELLVATAEHVGRSKGNEIAFVHAGGRFASQKNYVERVEDALLDAPDANLHFLGQRDDVPDILRESDVYLCTSLNEASPMAVWEALAAGLPVISTDVGDINRYFSGTRFGLVVDDATPGNMAKAICAIADDPAWLSAESRVARQAFAHSMFSPEKVARDHLELFRQVLNHIH